MTGTSPKTPTRPSRGPFISAALSTALASGLLIAIKAGWSLTLVTALAIFIPGMTFSTLLIAVSMGWIFVAFGRYHQKPKWVWGCGILIAITMLELLALTYLSNLAGKIQ